MTKEHNGAYRLHGAPSSIIHRRGLHREWREKCTQERTRYGRPLKPVESGATSVTSVEPLCRSHPGRFSRMYQSMWSSTCASAKRLVYLREAIKMNEVVEKPGRVMNDLDWSILKKVCMALEPYQKLPTMLDGEHYLADLSLVPLSATCGMGWSR